VFLYSNVRTRASLIAGFITDELTCSSQLVAEANNLKTYGVVIIGLVFNSRQTVDINCVRQIVTANMYFEMTDSSSSSQFAEMVSQSARAVCPPDYWSKSRVELNTTRPDLRAGGGRGLPPNPFIFYFSLMIDAYETTTYTHARARLTALFQDYPGEPVPER